MSTVRRVNAWLARRITRTVGTMYAAYTFTALALTGFPGLLPAGVARYTLWTSTIFLQLVLLSVILVGQNMLAAASDTRAQRTFDDAEKILQTCLTLEAHLLAQDAELSRLVEQLR